jgi:hypothetical protein
MKEKIEQPTIRLDLSGTPWIKCEGGNMLWDSSMLFKKLSPLVSPSGKEELLPAEIIICKKCGKVPQFFWEKAKEIPEDLRSTCHLETESEK